MDNFLSRTERLIGADAISRLNNSHVAVFGVGGVGGYAVEALVRAGVGEITLVDADTVSVSNINRQIIATVDTVGKDKVEAARERALSINPSIKINAIKMFFDKTTADSFDFKKYDYIIDAIDSVSGKIELALRAEAEGVRIISSMGTGNKLDPGAFEISDIYKTSMCPLARVIRTELKKRGVKRLKVLFSKEAPVKPMSAEGEERVPASISFVPSVAGLIIAGEVIKDIISNSTTKTI